MSFFTCICTRYIRYCSTNYYYSFCTPLLRWCVQRNRIYVEWMLCALIRSGSLKIHENFVTALVRLQFFHTNIGLRRNFHYFYHHAVIIWLSRCRCCCWLLLGWCHSWRCRIAHNEEERMSSCNFPQFIVIAWVFEIVVIVFILVLVISLRLQNNVFEVLPLYEAMV